MTLRCHPHPAVGYAERAALCLERAAAAHGIPIQAAGLRVLRDEVSHHIRGGALPDSFEVILDLPVVANWRAKRVPGSRWMLRLAYYGDNAERLDQAQQISDQLAALQTGVR